MWKCVGYEENLTIWLTKNEILRWMPTLVNCKLPIISMYGKSWSISSTVFGVTLKWIFEWLVGVELSTLT
jgi:hypothetical protein